ncbi:helix-turn-helix domain-containing protein [Aquimarina spongiae]|uniref:AraC-type DNA-binding protein n=1 Tax=Aquimarina spongiae TaxID=570521 RepID=A0A1M6A1E2_9FLAO|nr:AraC family transcriptional regulator [Aquimarina spongiae]SHI30331.1 AraC-type DNA-binding protein [Aquimarina spongiae]
MRTFKYESVMLLSIPLLIYIAFIPYYVLDSSTKIGWGWYSNDVWCFRLVRLFLHKFFFISYSFVFGLATIYVLNTFNRVGSKEDDITRKYNWFKIVLYIFTTFMFINFLYWTLWTKYFHNSFFTLFVGMLIHFLIYTIILKPDHYFYSNNQKKAYKNSSISKEEAARIAQKFLYYLEKEEPFLDDSFDLEKMATRLQVKKHFLSQVISQNLNSSFTKIVKKYRVEKSVFLLTQDKERKRKIADIAYECGFRDTSSFYRAFKEIKKVTPNNFREHL